MQLNLNECCEIELIAYKIILLKQMNHNEDVIKEINEELTKDKYTKRKAI